MRRRIVGVGVLLFPPLSGPGSLVDGHGTVMDVEPYVALFGFVGLGSGFDFGVGNILFIGGGVDCFVVEDGEVVDFGFCFVKRGRWCTAVACVAPFVLVAIDSVDCRSRCR